MERIFLLDRSGSMDSCLNDTIGGFNSFIRDQKSLGGSLSLFLFDHELTTVFENKHIDEVEDLTTNTFVPRGSTSLFDAIGHVLTRKTSSKDTMVIILTDGYENSSKIYTKRAIKDIIEMNTKLGATIMYLGANQNAFEEGYSLGIRNENVLNFDICNTPQAFESVSKCIRHRSTGDELTPI